jgi:hypothetical protein
MTQAILRRTPIPHPKNGSGSCACEIERERTEDKRHSAAFPGTEGHERPVDTSQERFPVMPVMLVVLMMVAVAMMGMPMVRRVVVLLLNRKELYPPGRTRQTRVNLDKR